MGSGLEDTVTSVLSLTVSLGLPTEVTLGRLLLSRTPVVLRKWVLPPSHRDDLVQISVSRGRGLLQKLVLVDVDRHNLGPSLGPSDHWDHWGPSGFPEAPLGVTPGVRVCVSGVRLRVCTYTWVVSGQWEVCPGVAGRTLGVSQDSPLSPCPPEDGTQRPRGYRV